MVYIERTSKGEDSYYFDADKLTRNDGISSEIDSSSDDNSGLEKILTSEDIQRAAENDTPDTTPNLSERFEFMQFLHLVEKLTNDNRDLLRKSWINSPAAPQTPKVQTADRLRNTRYTFLAALGVVSGIKCTKLSFVTVIPWVSMRGTFCPAMKYPRYR